MISLSAVTALFFAATTFAQGSAGGEQSSCSASQAWVSKGCFDTTNNGLHAGFDWQLSSSTSDANYYPGFTGSSSMTTETCLQACRGHGFKWAATFSGSDCYCAPQFPLATNPSSTNSGPGTPLGSSPGTPASSTACTSSCMGNSSEYCGGGDAANIYFDPSFSNDTAKASDPNQYSYVGCFSDVSPGPLYMTIETTSTADCTQYCGKVGYSFAGRSGIDSQSGTATCGCGSEIQAGYQIDESNCSNYCNGTAGAS